MNKSNIYNERKALKFKRFGRKGYSLFSCLGREVLIGTLSVATLTYAKADGISTDAERLDSTATMGDNRDVMLDEVQVTGSRAPLTQLQSAKIVAVITREDIHRAAAASINDVLKLATGVDVRQRGGFGVQTDISINGGTFDQITILLNGVSVSNPQTGHNASDFPVGLDDIERIEILEGASSRLFGSNAFSGAINIVTTRRASSEDKEIDARMEGGSYGTLAASAGVKARTGRLWKHVSGGYSRSDGGTEHSDFEKGRFYCHAQWASKRVGIDLQMGASAQSYGANTFYSVKYNNQYERTEHAMGSVSASLHEPIPGLVVKPTAYWNHFNDHYQLIRHEVGAAKGENYHMLDVYGASVDATYAWLLGKSAIGADIHQERIWSTAYGDLLETERWKDIDGSDRQYDHRAMRTNTSVFAEHNVVLEQWTLSMGMLANKNTGLDGGFRLYPGVDIAYRPGEHWKIYASWNKALRMPTYTDLYTQNVVQQGDIGLRPEKNDTYKVGARGGNQAVEATISAFYSRGRDMIDWVYMTEDATKYHAMNIGKLDNTGITADVDLRLASLLPQELGSVVRRLRLGYAYIHQKHETDQPIYKSLYALEYLRHKVTAQLDLHLWRQLSASWQYRWQQRMNGFTPYSKLDAKLTWDARSYTLYLKADNITGHRYYDLGGIRQPGLWLMAGGSLRLNL